MIRILLFTVIVLFSLTSCDYFDSIFYKKPTRIDFTKVDEYPVFPSCDSLATLKVKEFCFEETLSLQLETDLLLHEFTTPLSFANALIVHVKVDKEGILSFHAIESSVKNKKINAELKEVIIESISNFPKLKPAQKRGNAVQSTYMIPLYIIEPHPGDLEQR